MEWWRGPLSRMYEGSSFFELLRATGYPDPLSGVSGMEFLRQEGTPGPGAGFSLATTILALRFQEGVVLAGDRQATEGNHISSRTIEKVFPCDRRSAIAIAGAAGPCMELARLFQVELEHYEKMEGVELSLEGKANKLAQMIRSHMPLAMQGLVVIPIFAGFDVRKERGRIFRYDITGGRYEETDYHATGSGGRDARATLKKRFREGLEREEAIRIALEALMDAAEEDVGTGGPDPVREIYPSVKLIHREGIEEVSDATLKAHYEALVAARRVSGGR